MNADLQLEAGGLLPPKSKVDEGASETVVARSYRHPALGDRPVVRLASDRLGQAEDLAMEFLGFTAPAVSAPVAVQQRRSLGFAAWALINDPKNARYALDLVKRMKASARQARSKPGHAWDAFTAMAADLGRSARQFLPPFWEEVGRAFKDIGNQTYAGRALNKSLEAERVHALDSDRARRRDVVLEFVLSGCLSGSALSDYGNDLLTHYKATEAYSIFRDLCVRRTRGGMAPWATLPKDFIKLAKAAKLDSDAEFEAFLDEVIDAPAMGRAPLQFWKTCGAHCKRVVARNTAFAVALLRHTRPAPRYWGESKLGPWFDLLEEWGVVEYLWEEGRNGAPPLGEPVANWFGRIVRDEVPVPRRTLDMLEKLAPRLKSERTPLQLSANESHRGTDIDVDVLEGCLRLGVIVDDPAENHSVTFNGWLIAEPDHPLRNQDPVEAPKDQRFHTAIMAGLEEALKCRGGAMSRGYRQTDVPRRAFPLAAAERPGIVELWRRQAADVLAQFEAAGLVSFETARERLVETFWPDAIRLFPDLAERLNRIEPLDMLQRTLQAGIFDEYGLPALEEVVEKTGIRIKMDWRNASIFLTFPTITLSDGVHAHVIGSDGRVAKHELRLPKKATLASVVPVGGDLAIAYRDDSYQGHFHWASDPTQTYDCNLYVNGAGHAARMTALADGSSFLGQQVARPGDKVFPASALYLNDGERFWRISGQFDITLRKHVWKVQEVDPQTGKATRDSVPPWFEESEGGVLELAACEYMPAPPGAEESPLGIKDGILGWKAFRAREGGYVGIGIDGRRLTTPAGGSLPVALLRQPGTDDFLPVTASSRSGNYELWDRGGKTVTARLHDFQTTYAWAQATVLPLHFWHLLKVRDLETSKKLRCIALADCAALYEKAAADRKARAHVPRTQGDDAPPPPVENLLAAVKEMLPTAPPQLALGVARAVAAAEWEGAVFTTFREKAIADSKKKQDNLAGIASPLIDQAVVHWGLTQFHIYGNQGEASLSAHLAAVRDFLTGDLKGGELPRTNTRWFAMLEHDPLRHWQSYWRATAARMAQKGGERMPWLEFLKHWHELGIGDLPGRFDILEGHPEGAKKHTWGSYDVAVVNGRSFAIRTGDDAFVAIECESYAAGSFPHHFLRYSTAKEPGKPPGYQIRKTTNVKKIADKTEQAAFIAAAEASAGLPLPTPQELAELAEALSVSPAEVALVWLGGLHLDKHEHNFLPADLRNALKLKTTETAAARQALRNLKQPIVQQLFEAVVAAGSAAPFADDRTTVLHGLRQTWQSAMPKRLPLDAGLQKRLMSLCRESRWHSVEHEALLTAAADPSNHPLFQPCDSVIIADKGSNYRNLRVGGKQQQAIQGSFSSVVHLVALVHSETPAGHPARAAMPALIKQATKLLDHAGTLLDLRQVYLYDTPRKKAPTATEWINQHLGKTKANDDDGTDRYDDPLVSAAGLQKENRLLLAFRPAKLKNDTDYARLQGLMSIDQNPEQLAINPVLGLVALIKGPGFQKLAKVITAKNLPAGQWPQNPAHTAPDIVKAISKKFKLGDEAATLYAQLLALPNPTSANVCEWNGWSTAQYKKVCGELKDSKLVIEATRARAGRPIFLPGEWSDLKSPWLPIETWKLPHLTELDVSLSDPCPAGGPHVLRPFEDLFAAAWERVVQGDEPRYEEAKRKTKAKK